MRRPRDVSEPRQPNGSLDMDPIGPRADRVQLETAVSPSAERRPLDLHRQETRMHVRAGLFSFVAEVDKG
jgi:hypothetical protein